MRESYISFILPVSGKMPSYTHILEIDELLRNQSRGHEIVIIAPFTGGVRENWEKAHFNGPVSIVFTSTNSTKSGVLIAGLARCAGDLIIEWHGPMGSFSDQILLSMLNPFDQGVELVELEAANTRTLSRAFYKIANLFRSAKTPVRKIVGRSYSRRALSQILNSVSFEPQLTVLFAELSIYREVLKSNIKSGAKESLQIRIAEGLTLLLKGSRFGTVVPLSLAAISAVFGAGVSIYALALYLTVGKSPEGWTTLMIVTGLGQSSILALLGLTWSRIDSIARGLAGQTDATAEVVIIPPKT